VSTLSEMNHQSLIQVKYASLNGEYRKYNGKVNHVIYYTMKIANFGELYKFLEHTPNFEEKYARFYFRQLLDGI
jgi:serine/threonine protein kinase